MSKRMLSICRGYGCGALLPEPGYCPKHKREPKAREHWNELDKKKTPEMLKVYASRIWNKVSKRHKRNNPLCIPCKRKGRTTKVDITHHDPDLAYLLGNGLDPYSEEYLVSICEKCHMEELRNKRQGKETDNRTLLEKLGGGGAYNQV